MTTSERIIPETYIADKDKAREMAWSEHSYIDFEISARKAGMDDIAGAIALQRTQAGEAVGDKYDKEQKWMHDSLLLAADKAREFKEPAEPGEVFVLSANYNDRAKEFLSRLHRFFGCPDGADEAAWKQVTVEARSKAPSLLTRDCIGDQRVSKGQARKFSSSLGLEVRELRMHDQSRQEHLFVSLRTPFEIDEREVADRTTTELERLRKLREKASTGTIAFYEEEELKELEGLEGEELTAVLREGIIEAYNYHRSNKDLFYLKELQ